MSSRRGASIPELPFVEAGFSDAFTAAARKQGFYTLQQLLNIPLTELVKKDWITYDMWNELLKKMDEFPDLHGK